MIELKNVCYAYGNEIALRYINLNIQKGESDNNTGTKWMW